MLTGGDFTAGHWITNPSGWTGTYGNVTDDSARSTIPTNTGTRIATAAVDARL